jgi:hypothetical protein
MLKKSASGVLASLPGGVKRETRDNRGAAALPGIRRVLARQGWEGEMVAFLSILRECSPVIPNVQTSEIPVCPQSFPHPAKRGTGMATRRAEYWESLNREGVNDNRTIYYLIINNESRSSVFY